MSEQNSRLWNCLHGVSIDKPCVDCMEQDRATKDELATLRARAERAEAELRDRKDNQDRYFMEWRGLDPDYDKVCVKCGGAGTRTYGDTSTWRGGVGGQALTVDVCDRCWGSGNESKPWPSRRELQAAQSTIAELEATVGRLTEERDLAQEYLAGVLSVNPNVPDCIDNHDRAYQSQGLSNWGAAQLAAFRAALGE